MARDRETKRTLKRLGLKLRGIRNNKGWTLVQTEEKGWTSWVHLQRIESGKKDITFSTLIKLSRLYKIPLSELLSDF